MNQSSFSARPCWAEIDLRALEDNYRSLRGLVHELASAGAECVAVVKGDAYGHSLELCAPAAVRAGAAWLGVTSVEEAVAARELCPESRVLVMGGVFDGQGAAVVEHGITPSVWTLRQIEALEAALEGAARAAGAGPGAFAVHLEIDTGMSRQGAGLDELPEILARFTADSPLRVEAVMTHLYASDEADRVKSAAQLEKLEEALRVLHAANPAAAAKVEFLSAGASAALLGGDGAAIAEIAARWKLRPMLRTGLALYGVAPHVIPSGKGNAAVKLRPVMTWKTRVGCLREVPAGAEIGYNGTFTATEPMRLALVAAGYADGLDRRLGNRFSLLVRGERAPLVGRVSMDQAVIDVTEIAGVCEGDEVVILGAQDEEEVTAYDHADAEGTIPWEVFTRIAPRVARIAV